MRHSILLTLSLSLALTSCGGQENPDSAAAIDVDAWTGEMPISAPWLRDQLPAGIIAYQRIPNVFGLMAIPKGNMLDTALGSEVNIRNLIEIQQGLATNLADDSPLFADPRFRLIVEHLRSPIEVAGFGLPQPSAIVAMTLDLRSRADLEALFAELAEYPPLPGLMGPLDADGFGQLGPGLPIPVFLHFDESTGQLALFGGPMANPQALAALLEPAAGDAEPHPMDALEVRIDESGQGYFGWVDTAQALAMGAMFMDPEMNQMLQVTGLNRLQSVAFGAGVANGKGRLKVVADMGPDSSNRPFPIIDNRIDATSVGDPRSLFLLSIPSPEEYTRLENLTLSYFPPEIAEQWSALKDEMAASVGASIDEILSALGPELIAFSDRAGNYFGIRVRDQALLDDVLGRLAASAGITIGERTVDGQRIRHVSLPGTPGVPDTGDMPDMPDQATALLTMLGRMQTRFFWVAEGDYLYAAGMPQSLMDRARFGPDTNVGTWLDQRQRVDLSSSLVAATGTVANLPRMMYEFYIGMMQGIADIAEVEYDIWSMPTAAQLGLPERGTLGLSLNLGQPYVSLELAYESHPAEVLLAGGGTAAIAAAGVMAAIAVPAYQDYTIRAQVSEGMSLAAAAKAAVAETYLSTGSAPADRAAAGLTADAADTAGRYVQSIDIVAGEVIVRYGNGAHPRIAGRLLEIRPYLAADDSVVWVCGYGAVQPGLEPIGGQSPGGTTVEREYLPSACR